MGLFKKYVDKDNAMICTMLELICEKLGIPEKEYMDKTREAIKDMEG